MSARAFWLLVWLFGCASPAAATEASPAPAQDSPARTAPAAAPKEAGGWTVEPSKRLRNAVAGLRLKTQKGARVTLSFTVTGTGQITGVHAEGDPRAAQRVMAAVRKLGQVPAPPDQAAHPVAGPFRFN